MRWIKIKPLIKQTLPSLSPPPLNNHKSISAVIFARNIVILLGVVFFLCGLIHFLVRCLLKKKRATNSHSGIQDTGDHDERQLQQLFHLHDSGLDQAVIDALPLFLYKELMGSKEPFDCAVCLSEFSEDDKLRLLPLCSHAFHIHCIDTWLLSNSTCPLCRGTLFTPGFSVEDPVFDILFDDLMEEDDNLSSNSNLGKTHVGGSGNSKQSGSGIEKRVFSVRLGKFRATNGEKRDEKEVGETSNSNLDARRCFSMGSYEYVVGNSELQVTFNGGNVGNKDLLIERDKENSSVDGKKISSRNKGESFSVSKIWLWSKKDHHKFQESSDANMISSSVNGSLPSRKPNASNFPH